MDLFNDKIKDCLDREQIEHLQKKKHEYKLLGSYTKTAGMQLFCYRHLTKKIELIKIESTKTAKIVPNGSGGLTWVDADRDKVMVDSRDTFFEALNLSNAKKRVEKYEKGEISELCNLKQRNGVIKIY